MGIRIRPTANTRLENKLYSELLIDLLSKNGEEWDLFNNCKSRLLSSELIDFRDVLACQNPDVVVINMGAVDAPNRDIPKWFSDILFRRKWLFLHGLTTKLYNGLIKRFLRRPLVFMRLKSPWVGPKNFEKYVIGFLNFIEKDLKSKVVVLGINPANERIERELPGSSSRVKDYNEILKSISKRYQCRYIDTTPLSSSNYFPDGVHFNVEGHQWCAEQIFNALKDEN